MMRKSLLFGAMLLIASCTVQKEEDFEIPSQHRYHAVADEPVDAETRVYADSKLRVRWNEGDHISIFERKTYNQEFEFLGDTGDTAGDFDPVESGGYHTGGDIEDGHVYAVYPYDKKNKCDYEGKLTVTFPSVQHYKKDSFGVGANVMVAKTNTMDLRFMHVGGYRTFKLYGEGVSVSSVRIESNGPEYLSGRADVVMGEDGKPEVSFVESTSNSKSVELVCDTPVALGATDAEAVEFWFVLPPGTLAQGFTVTITDIDGNEFTKSTSNSIEIKSGVKKSMPAFEVKPEINPQQEYLTFSIIEGGTIIWKASHSSFERTIHYSLNGGPWTEITSTTDGVEISVSSGDKVRFYGENSAYAGLASATSSYQHSFFSGTASFEASGNIMSLLSPSFENLISVDSYCFRELFSGCSGLVAANSLVLPAETLMGMCYAEMFRDCIRLITAPELPATTLVWCCYNEMFYGCTSLTTAPDLPATTLAGSCYGRMFRDCTSLTTAPELPATTLASSCYIDMFSGCTSLTTAPDLPATTLAGTCYSGMFFGCTNLKTAPELPATTLADNCYQVMFYGCTSLETAPDLPAMTLTSNCYTNMFQGCTSLSMAPDLPADALTKECYRGMFANCTSLTTAPELPATSLVENCYISMFWGCPKLNHIKCLATNSGPGYTDNWLSGVSSTGTFVKNPEATWESGTNGIPTGWTVIDDTPPTAVPEAVDLGLPSGIKWASFNLGASAPEEYGDYYAWGETEPYYSSLDPLTWKNGKEAGYDWPSYKWCMGSYITLTKYCSDSSCGYNGFTDNKTVLDPDDDAAYVNLGGKWRMPTDAEWTELRENCTWEWTTLNGVNGRKVTSKWSGYTDKWIFFPAAGRRGGANLYSAGSYGDYWSSSLDTGFPEYAWSVLFYSGSVDRVSNHGRYGGQSVRPVCD